MQMRCAARIRRGRRMAGPDPEQPL